MSSFEDLADRVEGSISSLKKLVKQLDGEGALEAAQAKELQLQASRVLNDAEQSMKAISREVKATPSSKRRPLADKEAELGSALKELRDGLSRAAAKREREALLRKPDRAKQIEEAATDKLTSAASRAAANTQRLKDVQGVLVDTQDIGVGCVCAAAMEGGLRTAARLPPPFPRKSTLSSPPPPTRTATTPKRSVISTMNSQREALLRATDNTTATNELAGRGGQILRNMAARALTNKVLLLMIVVCLLAANGALIYVCLCVLCAHRPPFPAPSPRILIPSKPTHNTPRATASNRKSRLARWGVGARMCVCDNNLFLYGLARFSGRKVKVALLCDGGARVPRPQQAGAAARRAAP